MNINPSRIKYLASKAATEAREKAEEEQRKKEEQHVRLARLTNGVQPPEYQTEGSDK